MASRAMRLKLNVREGKDWEVSERRQVGDAEAMVEGTGGGDKPWWRDVGMEEGM